MSGGEADYAGQAGECVGECQALALTRCIRDLGGRLENSRRLAGVLGERASLAEGKVAALEEAVATGHAALREENNELRAALKAAEARTDDLQAKVDAAISHIIAIREELAAQLLEWASPTEPK